MKKKLKKTEASYTKRVADLIYNNRIANLNPFIPAIVWGIIILGASIMPGKNLPSLWEDVISPDKVAHALIYLVFTLLILEGIKRKGMISRLTVIGAVFFSALYGIGMEIVQYAFFPDRYFELFDIIANIIGSIGSLFLFYFFVK